MNVFFDVDYTILGLDDSLRPRTREVFQKIIEAGHLIYVWSGLGERWEVIKKHKLRHLVSGVYTKPLDRFHARLNELGVPFEPDFVVDDYPEVVAAFGGAWVPPYFFKSKWDDEMEQVYNIIIEIGETGHSENRRYKSKGSKITFF